jgi:hypothetical protein
MVHLNQQARNNLQKHIHETISAEYQKACNTLRITWSIVSKTEDEKTRLQALALINDVNKYRTELVTNDVIVDGALRIVQSKMDHFNGNVKGGEKRLLRDIKQGISSQEPELEEQEEQELKATNGVI